MNLSAQILSPVGTLISLLSLVTVPTTATILELNCVTYGFYLPDFLLNNEVKAVIALSSTPAYFFSDGLVRASFAKILVILEMEIGYLLRPDWFNLLRMTLLNLESVLLFRKL